MDLSVVVVTWRRSAEMLLHSVHTLSNQTEPPLEIIVVDTNTEQPFIDDNQAACALYPLARIVHAPRAPFNLAKGMNAGIKPARGQYVMATCMEMLFSRNVVERLAVRMRPDYYGQAVCGVLPASVPVGPIETMHDRWDELCDQVMLDSLKGVSAGAIMIATREWWYTIKGYDEVHYPVWENDVDNARQAHYAGLKQITLTWAECQVIHPQHERITAGFQTGGEWCFGVTDDIVRNRERNPQGWGEG